MTRNEALLEAITPLRQSDFSLVRETLEGINFPTPTTRLIKATIHNLLAYLEAEKDLADVQVVAILPKPGEKPAPKRKRRIKRVKK